MNCKLCFSEMNYLFNKIILKKYNVGYYQCSHCDFLSTEEAHWLNEAYSNSITGEDTGLVARNLRVSSILKRVISYYFFKHKNSTFVDYAGGYGLLTRLMRDLGFNFFWFDKYTENLYVSEYIHRQNNSKYKLLSAIEYFEHLPNPIDDISNLFDLSDNIFFTTELLDKTDVVDQDWWYLGPDHGQHISFYSVKTLEYLAKKYNKILLTDGKNIHLFLDSAVYHGADNIVFQLILGNLSCFDRLKFLMLLPFNTSVKLALRSRLLVLYLKDLKIKPFYSILKLVSRGNI